MKKKERKAFWYFVLVSPILAKIIEWFFQYLGYGNKEDFFMFLKTAWFFQLVFIVLLSLGIYAIMRRNHLNLYKMTFIVAIAYFLKEVYNLIAIYKILSQPVLIALTLEPIFMWFVLGYLPYKLYFKGKG